MIAHRNENAAHKKRFNEPTRCLVEDVSAERSVDGKRDTKDAVATMEMLTE